MKPRKWISTTTRILSASACSENVQTAVIFVSDRKIRELNRTYRGIDKPTDVLSFPAGTDDPFADPNELGDVIISLQTAQRQAAERGIDPDEEIARLVIHGLLHLMGHDHHEPAETRAMRAKERKLLKVALEELSRSEPAHE